MTRCSNCGTENEPGRKFCRECGTRLAAGCPNCGTPNAADAKFCGECGTSLVAGAPGTASAPPPSAHAATAPVAERRVVSILFADLVGFTPFAEERDAEETRETLSRYFDLARDVIGRYGGTVEKFIGDAVMAVWGAPVATENDAERAVRAGLDLVVSVGGLAPGVQARAGVLTGEAAITIGATDQGMVAGDLVNTASRLQSVAPAGSVLVGAATFQAAANAIVFEEAGEQVLKGKVAPVRAWRALRVVAEVGGRNRREAVEAPFVGRDEELRQLKDMFHATTREKRARLVSVVGPAGIGKSRLAWEFLKYIDGLLEGIWWHDGRSPSYGDGITFWALGEMIRRRAGLRESDDEATTRSSITASVEEHVADPDERRWIERALLVLLGVESGMSSEELFPAWRTFFERLSEVSPVAMVFEDLHWADRGTLDFIDHLLEWSRNRPIFVLTLARPELLERRADWGAGKRNFASLFLEPLDEPAMRELLLGLVPDLPEPALRAILARADGIPLYAIETIRMLLAEGRLELRGNAYAPLGDLTQFAVPDTLSALIAARLDALEPADRAIVQDASVLGQSFTVAALAGVGGRPEVELEGRLRGLVRRELMRVEADPRSPERGQYVFVQGLIREVAYNMLARNDRKTRHLAAARYFEGLGGEELAGALAGQYLSAHANAGPPAEAEALAAQARIALRAAAQRAAALGSHGQAAGFLLKAVTVTSEPAEQADLLEAAAAASMRAADARGGERQAEQAVALRRELGDRVALADAIARLGQTIVEQYDNPRAVAFLEPAMAEFADLGPDAATLANQFARALFLDAQSDASIRVCDQFLGDAERLGRTDLVADGLITKGSALAVIGRPIEGLGVLEVGQRVAERAGLASAAARAMVNRTYYLAAADPREAWRVAAEGLEYTERMGLVGEHFGILGNAAFAALHVGEWSAVHARIEAALGSETLPLEERIFLFESASVIEALRGAPIAAARLAEVQAQVADRTDVQVRAIVPNMTAFIALGEGRDRDAADAWLEVTRLGLAIFSTVFLEYAARALLWAGDLSGARSALAGLVDQHGPAEVTGRGAIEAGVAALEGDGSALGRYGAVLRMTRDLGLVFDIALIGIDMATLLEPDEPEVAAAAQEAREILVRLEAKPLIERLDRAMARGAAQPASGPSAGQDAGDVNRLISSSS